MVQNYLHNNFAFGSNLRVCLIVAGVFASQVVAHAANIVQNPGFEGATLGSWVSTWDVGPIHPRTGLNAAGTGCVGLDCISANPDPAGSWIYQDLVTTPGTSYTLSFWLGMSPDSSVNATAPNEVKVLWNGAEVFDVKDLSQPSYVQYAVTVVASGPLTRLQFLGRNDPYVTNLDDVSVDAGGVPEPSTWILMATGIAGLALRRRK